MPLQIYDARERRLVRAADGVLSAVAALRAPFRRHRVLRDSPRRILLLRLERIGDLLMTLPAIADVRGFAPDAEIDLVVGRWNAALADAIPGSDARRAVGCRRGSPAMPAVQGCPRSCGTHGRGGRGVTISPSISSRTFAAICCVAASGAAWTVGYRSGGGGSLLDLALDFEPRTPYDRQRAPARREVFGRRADRRRTAAAAPARSRGAQRGRPAGGVGPRPNRRDSHQRGTSDQAVGAGSIRRHRAQRSPTPTAPGSS